MIEARLQKPKGEVTVHATVGSLHPYGPEYSVTVAFEDAKGKGPWYILSLEDARALVLALEAKLDGAGICAKCGRAMHLASESWAERCPKDQSGGHRA